MNSPEANSEAEKGYCLCRVYHHTNTTTHAYFEVASDHFSLQIRQCSSAATHLGAERRCDFVTRLKTVQTPFELLQETLNLQGFGRHWRSMRALFKVILFLG
jgi:hypothetical protein